MFVFAREKPRFKVGSFRMEDQGDEFANPCRGWIYWWKIPWNFVVQHSIQNWVVVSNIFYFHPYLGKIPILTNIFQRGWNHQPEKYVVFLFFWNLEFPPCFWKNNNCRNELTFCWGSEMAPVDIQLMDREIFEGLVWVEKGTFVDKSAILKKIRHRFSKVRMLGKKEALKLRQNSWISLSKNREKATERPAGAHAQARL